MFKNIEEIKSFISLEEIFSIDIRYIGKSGYWEGVSFLSSNFDFSLLEKGLYIEGYKTNKIDITRSFFEVFLAHKTLVFLADLTDTTNSLIFNNKEKESLYELSFKLSRDANTHVIDNSCILPPFDNSRDFRTEIVVALVSMLVDVVYHYESSDSNVIVIKSKKSLLHHVDDIQKVKYAIIMVAKAYDIDVDLQKGIFVDYKDIYKVLK